MMRAAFFTLAALTLFSFNSAFAQSDFTAETETGSVLEPTNTATLQTLDKVTGRTGTASVTVGETVKLGTLYLAVRTCRKAPPIEQPEAAAFVHVWQTVRDENGKLAETPESEWVFSGWMYASSPSVSAMDHPVYDVWVIDCNNK
jgi:hypothetical protein